MGADKLLPGSSKREEVNFSKMNTKEKLRILCLHGYRQNSDTFKSKLGSFRKVVQKYAEFSFITAPHQAPALQGIADGSDISDQKSWWFNKDDGSFKGTNTGGPAIGFEESLNLVESVWKEDGPFDGLLGFSQGACFVGLLCGLSLRGLTSVKPRFAIIASGFLSGSLVHKNFYEDVVTIPSCHIYGENDDIIPPEMSKMLASNFESPEILTHSGGHYFPATAQQKQAYITFFQNHLKDCLLAKDVANIVSEEDTIVINNSS